MGKDLTAAELYAIYAPAWEAAPESRPVGVTWDGDVDCFRRADRRGNHRFMMDEDDAANACRCAAEDWLMREAGEIIVADHSRIGGVARVTLGDTRLTCSRMWAGETIHHALAAAVVAVAKAQNPRSKTPR